MCANCKPVGLKLDGEKLVTVYSPAPAETLAENWAGRDYHHLSYSDGDSETFNEMSYSRTKADQ